MTTKEYISSGVLELYVMGGLTEQEMRKVECMALVHDDISEELKRIELAYEKLALETQVEPSESLKADIWASIEAGGNNQNEEIPVVKLDNDSQAPKRFNWARAASIVAIVGLGVALWSNVDRNNKMASDIESQEIRQDDLNARLNASEEKLDLLSRDMAVVCDYRYLGIRLKGTENAPDASVQVFWNTQSSEVYLAVQEMAELEKNKVYQLWVLDEGQPIDVGTFTPTKGNRLVKMKDVVKGQTFAVTIQQVGGSESPALETLQVIGDVPEDT
jgi:anti-sigma-K factor RskA